MVTSSASLYAIVDDRYVEYYANVSYEANTELERLLDELNPNLKDCLSGARTVLSTGPSDWPRHFGVSYRKLLTTLLAELAPNKLVWEWSKDRKKDFHKDEKGNLNIKKPTRNARIRYIIETHKNKHFRQYFTAVSNAIIEYIDFFSNFTHSEKPDFTPNRAYFSLQLIEGFIYQLLKGVKENRFL